MGVLIVFASMGVSRGQDRRTVTEPSFPVACTTVTAPLGMSGGAIYSSDDTDTQSSSETTALQEALKACAAGKAVELVAGMSTNAFLINPLTLPSGVSLIVDGGVTVFGSRDPAMYQVSGSNGTCGVTSTTAGACQALITSTGIGSGIYGYGVIDGRGYAPMLSGANAGQTWWSQTNTFNYSIPGSTQNLPEIVNASGGSFTLYKITLRNAPWYHVIWANSAASPEGFTAWGIKIQSPWSVPNTDGIDIWGEDATVMDSTFSNGDDDVAIDAWENAAGHITLSNLTIYGMNGLTIGSGIGKGVSYVQVENSNITSYVASLSGTTVNGMTESTMESYGVSSYQEALPSHSGNSRGLNIKTRPENGSANNVTYSNLCMRDVDYPITIQQYNGSTGSAYPIISDITYQNIHVLQPLSVPETSEALVFQGYSGGTANTVTINNLVVDDQTGGVPAISAITASYNNFTTVSNVYPETLNELDLPSTIYDGTILTTSNNIYTSKATEISDGAAYACPVNPNPFPYIVGELYLSVGAATNLQSDTVASGSMVTLHAMVQPAMSQVTEYVASYAGAGHTPVLAVASPALTRSVQFLDGGIVVGYGGITGNGTTASLTLPATAGTHTYTAMYPGDSYYGALPFGSVVVTAQ